MTNNKQSSIDYYAFEVLRLHILLENRTISVGEFEVKHRDLKQQAKAMHKEEIESTYDDAIMKGRYQEGVEYYKEKFGGNNEQ